MKTLFQLVKKVNKISWKDRLLLLEAFVLSGIIRFAILFIAFKKLASCAGNYMEESSEEITGIEQIVVNKVEWSIQIISRITPWQSKCFVKALTGQIMLKRRKISATLYLGVALDSKKRPAAHAWLRSGTTILTGRNGYNKFTQVAKFATNIGGNK